MRTFLDLDDDFILNRLLEDHVQNHLDLQFGLPGALDAVEHRLHVRRLDVLNEHLTEGRVQVQPKLSGVGGRCDGFHVGLGKHVVPTLGIFLKVVFRRVLLGLLQLDAGGLEQLLRVFLLAGRCDPHLLAVQRHAPSDSCLCHVAILLR